MNCCWFNTQQRAWHLVGAHQIHFERKKYLIRTENRAAKVCPIARRQKQTRKANISCSMALLYVSLPTTQLSFISFLHTWKWIYMNLKSLLICSNVMSLLLRAIIEEVITECHQLQTMAPPAWPRDITSFAYVTSCLATVWCGLPHSPNTPCHMPAYSPLQLSQHLQRGQLPHHQIIRKLKTLGEKIAFFCLLK